MPERNEKVKEFLRLNTDGYLFHRESRELEFKEQFNLAGLAEYFRDFAAFANNVGGYLICGVSDSPRELKGLNQKSKEQFEKIDPQKISGYLLEIFSSEIHWEQFTFKVEQKTFGIFYVHQSRQKPIITRKNEGKEHILKNGEIYYRYGGRTQNIQSAELQSIIQRRLDDQNKNWTNLISKIAKAGPTNAAILDLEKGVIEKNNNQVLVLDESLIGKIKFVREGDSSDPKGDTTLKLVGDVHPIDAVEVVKIQEKHLTDLYPFSAMELISEVKGHVPSAKPNDIWTLIKENDLKNDTTYSAYNFRNRAQEEDYKKTGIMNPNTPSIYNLQAIEFIVRLLNQFLLP